MSARASRAIRVFFSTKSRAYHGEPRNPHGLLSRMQPLGVAWLGPSAHSCCLRANGAALLSLQMDPIRFGDLPSLQTSLRQARGLLILGRFLEMGRPLLRMFGINVQEVEGRVADLELRVKEVEEIRRALDRFTGLFGQRGWIAYDFLNSDAARRAVSMAEQKGLDAGEEILLSHYSSDEIAWQLRAMVGIAAFRPRMRLAELALDDFSADRYHASVPVVLALLDGMVSELGDKSFFSKSVDLTAYDCLAAHQGGLERLKAMFNKRRQRTTTDELSIPYRNGILHGRDLGYANRKVAVKAWVALFAAADWARHVQNGRRFPPSEEPRPSLMEALSTYSEIKDERRPLEAWSPRKVLHGPDAHRDVPDEFERASPERSLAEFLLLWKQRNYGHMAQYLYKEQGLSPGRSAGRVRKDYSSRRLAGFTMFRIRDEAPAMTTIAVQWCYEAESVVAGDERLLFRMAFHDQNGSPILRGSAEGKWVIITWGHDDEENETASNWLPEPPPLR